jgi:hypothetical protein
MRSQKNLRHEARIFSRNYAAHRHDAAALVSNIASVFSKETIGTALGRTLNTRDMEDLSRGRGLSPAHTRMLFANI